MKPNFVKLTEKLRDEVWPDLKGVDVPPPGPLVRLVEMAYNQGVFDTKHPNSDSFPENYEVG